MLCLDLSDKEAQRFEQNIREHGDAVIFALAITHDNLTITEIEVFDAQAHHLHQAEAATVHKLSHQLINAIHIGDDAFRLIPGKDGGDAFGSGWADRDEGVFLQLDIENIAVQKEDCADSLISPAPTAGAV